MKILNKGTWTIFTRYARGFKSKPQLTVKAANNRVSRAFRDRKDAEARPRKVTLADPNRKFEPFPFEVTEDNKTELLNGIINPLYTTPYKEQLAAKEAYCRNSLRRISQELYKSGTPVRVNVSRLPCHVSSIIGTDKQSKYRNKEEFSIWRGIDGQSPTVGYMMFPIGKHGDTICVEPTGIEILRPEAGYAAAIFQDFIRNQAKQPVCYQLGVEAGWRRFGVRINVRGEIMLIGYMSPTGLTVQQVIDERENFRDFVLQRSHDSKLNLKSLYFQPCPYSRCYHTAIPYELLYGEPRITETIAGFQISVSPESYIPPNSEGAAILYQTAKKAAIATFDYSEKSIKPLVINPACGPGLLTMSFADIASRVVGVDHSDQAVTDAQYNASKNSIDNIEFICSDFEIVFERILEKHSKRSREVLLVAHPTKRGLSRHIIDTIRRSRNIRKLVLILPSLESPSIVENLISLCEKSSDKSGPQFMPILAIPVDISPHVESCETILILERLTQD